MYPDIYCIMTCLSWNISCCQIFANTYPYIIEWECGGICLPRTQQSSRQKHLLHLWSGIVVKFSRQSRKAIQNFELLCKFMLLSCCSLPIFLFKMLHRKFLIYQEKILADLCCCCCQSMHVCPVKKPREDFGPSCCALRLGLTPADTLMSTSAAYILWMPCRANMQTNYSAPARHIKSEDILFTKIVSWCLPAVQHLFIYGLCVWIKQTFLC